MSDLRKAAEMALEALENYKQGNSEPAKALRQALAQPKQEPRAWMHNFIEGNVITHKPVDIDRNPDRWTALYFEPQPCPTCEALARTVMMDQTSHDTAPPSLEAAVLAEREECAKVCDEKTDAEYATGKVDHNEMAWTQSCAMAIRERGRR